MAVEYPGYGVYKGEPTEEAIVSDAEKVLDFVRTVLSWPTCDIILCGRSIGSGPATYLASKVKTIGALALISPYTSIKGVVGDSLGTLGKLGKHLIKERFPNLERIRSVTCPTYLLHGKRDKLIPPQHSKELKKACKGVSYANYPPRMDHNEFSFLNDFVLPFRGFIEKQLVIAPS
jgi:fermentation-respiration switch protein FrsA (DUF1100 family)